MNDMIMVVDGQWGSTGKGLISGYLATKEKPDSVVCNFGPNAGHTVVTDYGAMVTTILPSGIISDSVKKVMIGPGAVINLTSLSNEIGLYGPLYLNHKKIYVHEAAAVVTQVHRDTEAAALSRISSTCKGTGEAMCSKIRREPMATIGGHHKGGYLNSWLYNKIEVVSHSEWLDLLDDTDLLQIESAQGMELGINAGFYPFCTSRDIGIWQILSDCGIPNKNRLSSRLRVIASMRTYPIRVGNAYDKEGNLLGVSGPVYDDQRETTWEELGLEIERTTVTNKIRRVFTWSKKNMEKVVRVLNPDIYF